MNLNFVYSDAVINYSKDCISNYFFTLTFSNSFNLNKNQALEWLQSEIQELQDKEEKIRGKLIGISEDKKTIIVKLDLPDSLLLVGEKYSIKIGNRKSISAELRKVVGNLVEFEVLNKVPSSFQSGSKVEITTNNNILLYNLVKNYISGIRVNELTTLLPKVEKVIDGPPGSGKTSELAHIIRSCNDKRILVISLSNVAVDNMLNRIRDLNPVKVGIKKFFDNVKYFDQVGGTIQEKIVGMTLASFAVAVQKKLVPSTFDLLIIDEASMIPFALGIFPFIFAQKVIIAGDNRQLKPIVFTTPQNTYPAWESLMKIAVSYAKNTRKYVYLNSQFRGRKDIYDIIAKAFYTDVGLQVNQYMENNYKYSRNGDIFDEILNEKCGITWVQIRGATEEWKSHSAYNKIEAAILSLLYSRLKDNGVGDIGIITNFRAQASLIQKLVGIEASHLGFSKGDGLDYLFGEYVSTVDGFQGGEKLVVLYSMVVSKVHESIRDFRRINVALSRAKEKLVILSSINDVCKLPFLCFIKSSCHKRNCYVELDVKDLNQNSEFQAYLEKISG
ncbi:DEAD/DEAH box helicase [Saccharolobus islandicus]|uniref:DEAD/DEAH box helicase n=1 Tax=Saccharolobus islandicus TaxID=43080 RepID=UPI003D7EC3EF